MSDPSLIALFVRPLLRLRIPNLITGGVASGIYGEPRFTRDIDRRAVSVGAEWED